MSHDQHGCLLADPHTCCRSCPEVKHGGLIWTREDRGGHCCIKAMGVLASHQNGAAGPLGTLKNHDKPGIRRPVAWLRDEQVDQVGRADRLMQL